MGDLKIKKIDPSQIRYTPEEGELVQTPEGKYMIWHDGSWNEIKMENGGINMGLYDMNKQIISQLPYMEDFEKAMDDIWTLYETYHNKYFMLYGKEISYFTVFQCGAYVDTKMSNEFVECLRELGEIKSIELTSDGGAIEVWICQENQEATVLYFFPYDRAIIRCGE